MKVKRHILIILLLFMMLFVCIGSVSALENQTNDIVENEVISVSESSEILTAGEQIGTGEDVNLTKGNNAYAEGDGDTIEISASGVIDGNDEVIGMADDGIGSDDGKISVQTVNDAKSAVDGAAEVDSQNALAVSDENKAPDSSFKDLQSLIDAAPEGSEITLNNNYSLDDNGKSIKISKSITINGNGTTLNANVHDRIISIEADNKEIVLKNIKFENGHLEKSVGAAYGGAI